MPISNRDVFYGTSITGDPDLVEDVCTSYITLTDANLLIKLRYYAAKEKGFLNYKTHLKLAADCHKLFKQIHTPGVVEQTSHETAKAAGVVVHHAAGVMQDVLTHVASEASSISLPGSFTLPGWANTNLKEDTLMKNIIMDREELKELALKFISAMKMQSASEAKPDGSELAVRDSYDTAYGNYQTRTNDFKVKYEHHPRENIKMIAHGVLQIFDFFKEVYQASRSQPVTGTRLATFLTKFSTHLPPNPFTASGGTKRRKRRRKTRR